LAEGVGVADGELWSWLLEGDSFWAIAGTTIAMAERSIDGPGR
jgi:hypothetical protein